MIEPSHEFNRTIPNNAVAVDQLFITVAKERAHSRKAMFEMKEHCTTANERFDVAIDFLWEELSKLIYEARLAASPFEKRASFNPTRTNVLEKWHRHLLFSNASQLR